jgi:hypothetical protein
MGLNLWQEFTPEVRQRVSELYKEAGKPMCAALSLLESEILRLRPDDEGVQQIVAALRMQREIFAGGIELMIAPLGGNTSLGDAVIQQVTSLAAQNEHAPDFPDTIDG